LFSSKKLPGDYAPRLAKASGRASRGLFVPRATVTICETKEAGMTAYLISLALAGLIAIALWEGFS